MEFLGPGRADHWPLEKLLGREIPMRPDQAVVGQAIEEVPVAVGPAPALG